MRVFNHGQNPIEHAGHIFAPRTVTKVKGTAKINHHRLEVLAEPKPKPKQGESRPTKTDAVSSPGDDRTA